MLGLDVVISTAVGAIGGIVGKWMEKGIEKDKRKHELDMAQVALEEREIEFKHELEVGNLELRSEQSEAAWSSFEVAQKGLATPTGSKLVDGLRSLTRVIITLYLIVVASKLSMDVSAMVGGLDALSAKELTDIYKQIISNIFNLTGIAVGFWFGTRFGDKK